MTRLFWLEFRLCFWGNLTFNLNRGHWGCSYLFNLCLRQSFDENRLQIQQKSWWWDLGFAKNIAISLYFASIPYIALYFNNSGVEMARIFDSPKTHLSAQLFRRKKTKENMRCIKQVDYSDGVTPVYFGKLESVLWNISDSNGASWQLWQMADWQMLMICWQKPNWSRYYIYCGDAFADVLRHRNHFWSRYVYIYDL